MSELRVVFSPQRIVIGSANGRIVMDLNEEDARDHLRLMEDEYGANDGACIELRDAIERAYPPEEDEDER